MIIIDEHHGDVMLWTFILNVGISNKSKFFLLLVFVSRVHEICKQVKKWAT